MKDADLYDWARARARQLRLWYLHIGLYAVVIVFLLVINAVTRDAPGSYMFGGHMYHHGGGDWWVIWPALGWGIALAIHTVFVLVGGAGKMAAWEDRKVDQLVRREKERSGV